MSLRHEQYPCVKLGYICFRMPVQKDRILNYRNTKSFFTVTSHVMYSLRHVKESGNSLICLASQYGSHKICHFLLFRTQVIMKIDDYVYFILPYKITCTVLFTPKYLSTHQVSVEIFVACFSVKKKGGIKCCVMVEYVRRLASKWSTHSVF